MVPPALQQARNRIARATDEMTRLIADVRDMSSITAGKFSMSKKRVEITKVIQGAVEASRPFVEKQGHELSVTLPKRRTFVDADPTRLGQVFQNILINAAKYTEPGGRISVNARREGSDVFVAIRDTGIGIPADKLLVIFELFSQVDENSSRSHGGLGIGLALVNRLVELHGGSIEAHSDGPGKGSEFVVRLPMVGEIDQM